MTVLVYQDYVHNNGVLFRRLCDHYGADQVRYADASDIAAGILDTSQLFVMPGGADLYYCEKLNGDGNETIRAFAENGGTYLGICAGAYYGCREIEWAKEETQPICGPRELAFYNGKAIGPVYDFIEDGDFTKSWDGAPLLSFGDIECPVFYSGGPVFEGPEENVIARYSSLPDNPAAIVALTLGKGEVVLCSPHLEYNGALLRASLYQNNNTSHDHTAKIADTLSAYDETLDKLWGMLLDRCSIEKNEAHKIAAA